MKQIIILIASVKYPSSENFYLTADSYLLENNNQDELKNNVDAFKIRIEVDGFKITNMLVYIVPKEQIENAYR